MSQSFASCAATGADGNAPSRPQVAAASEAPIGFFNCIRSHRLQSRGRRSRLPC